MAISANECRASLLKITILSSRTAVCLLSAELSPSTITGCWSPGTIRKRKPPSRAARYAFTGTCRAGWPPSAALIRDNKVVKKYGILFTVTLRRFRNLDRLKLRTLRPRRLTQSARKYATPLAFCTCAGVDSARTIL